jgi:PAS domain S-box-containing protein
VVADLSKDYDGDGILDRIGDRVTLVGRVSLGKMMAPKFNSAYIQDASGGVRLDDRRSLGEIVYGDSVEVSGKVVREGRNIALDLERIEVRATNRTILPSIRARNAEPNLSPLVGNIVTVEGFVVSKAVDADGSYLLVNRTAGPIAVRIDNRSPRSVAWTGQRGHYVRVTGVLDHYRHDDPFSYQMYTRSDSDFEKILIPPPYYPWAGGIALGLVVFVTMSLLKRVRGSMRSRERQFRAIFEQVGTPILFADSNLKVIDANRAACKLLKQTGTQIRFRRLKQFIKIADDNNLADTVSLLRVGSIESFTAGVWSEHVGDVDVEVVLTRIRFGRKDYYIATLHDVSQHMEAVTEFKQFHERLLNAVPLEVSVLTPSGKYVYANDHVGYGQVSLDWLTGKSDLELCRKLDISTDIALRRRAHRRRAVSGEGVIGFEEEVEIRGEVRHFLRSYAAVAVGPENEVAAVASYALDITELKKNRIQLAEAQGEVDKVGHLKEAFLENINQEFRKPITGIIGFAEILQGEVSDEQSEFVGLIERNGRRLMNTLNAVLDLAGLSNNEFDLSPKVLNIVEEVGQIVAESRETAEEKGLFLKIEASETDILTRADHACLTRVVQSLVDNSIKFTDAGGVIVELDEDDDNVNVRVLDTGMGIDADLVPGNLDDLGSEDLNPTHAARGAGIGLGITKRLVELMNGTISMESDKEGSMFSLTLPRAFPMIGRNETSLPRLLLADDSVDVHMMVGYVLQDYFRIDVAEDIETLYRQSRRSQYDVILVDLGLSGYRAVVDVVEKIRSRRSYKDVAFVALEEQGRRTDRDQVLGDGFNYFLGKPYRKSELLNLLSQVMADRIDLEIEDDDLEDPLDDMAGYRKSA